jgi:exonuclease III
MVGRAQYIILEWQGEKIGILNIYAPNTVVDRIELWSHLLSSLPQNIDHWCIGGDFNMLKHPIDCTGGRGDTIRGNKLAKWDELSMSLRIRDVWKSSEFITHKGSRLYSRTDLSHNPVNQSRLDRFYVTNYFKSLGGMVMIVPDVSLSDHAPILLRIDSKEPTHRSPKS